MTRRIRSILRTIVFTVSALLLGAFALNWFFTYRIEKYLRTYLSDNVSKATDGFYQFSFDHLSIGLFDGELSIRGISMRPDTIVFESLKKKDSLPDTYFKINIESIDLKGINLAWRINYRKLHFTLFEIKSPHVDVVQIRAKSDTLPKIEDESNTKTLYEQVAPYFDLVDVKLMNMENATFSYTVALAPDTVVYALHQVNFHAYGFVLDKNSDKNGKFLFCDNVDFIADKPQTILEDNHFRVNTSGIVLNTRDSLIKITGAQLEPLPGFWSRRLIDPGNYVEAKIDTVEVNGIWFKRENGLNELYARHFLIGASYINSFTVKEKGEVEKITVIEEGDNDQKITPWTLYDLVSPILSKVAIDKIAIEDTELEYNEVRGSFVDTYTLNGFDFHADNFLLDSLVMQRNRFWHCEDYVVKANVINGRMATRNCNISLQHLLLNTHDGIFGMKNIELSQLSPYIQQDYITGTIQSIDFTGLSYNKGIDAENLIISRPKVQYFKKEAGRSETKKIDDVKDDTYNNVFGLFVPYADYVRVRNIKLNNADITYSNLQTTDSLQLNGLNFYATDFLIDETTLQNNKYYFSCRDFGFNFANLDNLLPGKKYRLQVGRGELSHLRKRLMLQDVRLIPQVDTWTKAPDIYYDITIPLIEVKNAYRGLLWGTEGTDLLSLYIQSPQIGIVKTRQLPQALKSEIVLGSDLKDLLSRFVVNSVDVENANISYSDHTASKSYHTAISTLAIDSAHQSEDGMLTIKNLNLGNILFDAKQSGQALQISIPAINLDYIGWNNNKGNPSLSLKSVDIKNPSVRSRIGPIQKEEKIVEKDLTKNIYDILGAYVERMDIGHFRISGANLDLIDNKAYKNTIGASDFSFDSLHLHTLTKAFTVDNLRFAITNLHLPVSNYYTLAIDKIGFDSNQLTAGPIHLIPAYNKEEFAYKHPKHKDWFDVSVGNVTMTEIDAPAYLVSNTLKASVLRVSDVDFLNYKNQQIEIEHNIMPMIYEGLQKMPFRFAFDSLDVRNFSVVYEELPKKGTVASKIFFEGMNGKVGNFTNIPASLHQVISLKANGRLMGTGYFDATWQIPVSPDYDRFLLDAHITRFDLRDLNQLITPMASSRINSGYLNDMTFSIDATSEGASIDMLFLYDGLNISVFRDAELIRENRLATRLANYILKENNPDKANKEPREVQATIVRDKYHSTFNYLWQIIQPPLIESVGVSKQKQQFGRRVSNIINSIKNFFYPSRKKKKGEKPEKDE